ncbi:unnamed protein product [Pleuronectes platessa]|uniref:Uncharacterized protein n=1 Tax=Pleuronectes platessa TaxID=8262 RepID=A0A9N7TU77_PLEPL|nr:unnamed protein product [Pleuronectes platessa]
MERSARVDADFSSPQADSLTPCRQITEQAEIERRGKKRRGRGREGKRREERGDKEEIRRGIEQLLSFSLYLPRFVNPISSSFSLRPGPTLTPLCAMDRSPDPHLRTADPSNAPEGTEKTPRLCVSESSGDELWEETLSSSGGHRQMGQENVSLGQTQAEAAILVAAS